MRRCPLVSIIVPVYNKGKYIKRCIDSILQQSYQNLEIILVDDGSTDNSLQICGEYTKRDLRICLISQTNQGVSAARNTGINIAKGEYLAFIDADDFVHQDYIKILLDALLENKADISICLFHRGEEENFDGIDVYECNFMKVYSNVEGLKHFYDNSIRLSMVIPVCKICSAHLYNNIKYPVGKIHEDEFVTHKLLYESSKIIILQQPLYYYYQSPNSITRSTFNLRRLDAIEAFEERLEFCKNKNLEEFYNKTIFEYAKLIIIYIEIIKELSIKEYEFCLKQLENKLLVVVKELLPLTSFRVRYKFFSLIYKKFRKNENLRPLLYRIIFNSI